MRRTRRWLRAGIAVAVPTIAGLLLAPGEAPATIQEQRARLPPPAECADAVQGTWKSHAFNEMWQEWNVFTLTVRRVRPDGDELEGTITNLAWYGPATEENRGPCEGRLQYLVSMPAKGRIDGDHITFGGVEPWKLEEVYCSFFDGGYNLDQFAGTIDRELLEFQSVNNDGGRFVNVPTVFRRIQCLENEATDEGPRVAVAPPPFYPDLADDAAGSVGGCACK
jgi:hypothetical protein